MLFCFFCTWYVKFTCAKCYYSVKCKSKSSPVLSARSSQSDYPWQLLLTHVFSWTFYDFNLSPAVTAWWDTSFFLMVMVQHQFTIHKVNFCQISEHHLLSVPACISWAISWRSASHSVGKAHAEFITGGALASLCSKLLCTQLLLEPMRPT